MSLLSSLFSKKEDEFSSFNWIPLVELSQLDDIVASSSAKHALIFKHSTRCGISRSVLNQFEKQTSELQDAYDFYYLDLLNFRSISNDIAQRFNIEHQSPQILVVKDKKIVEHASHHHILDIDLKIA